MTQEKLKIRYTDHYGKDAHFYIPVSDLPEFKNKKILGFKTIKPQAGKILDYFGQKGYSH